jgi:hypothetical protein
MAHARARHARTQLYQKELNKDRDLKHFGFVMGLFTSFKAAEIISYDYRFMQINDDRYSLSLSLSLPPSLPPSHAMMRMIASCSVCALTTLSTDKYDQSSWR